MMLISLQIQTFMNFKSLTSFVAPARKKHRQLVVVPPAHEDGKYTTQSENMECSTSLAQDYCCDDNCDQSDLSGDASQVQERHTFIDDTTRSLPEQLGGLNDVSINSIMDLFRKCRSRKFYSRHLQSTRSLSLIDRCVWLLKVFYHPRRLPNGWYSYNPLRTMTKTTKTSLPSS